MKMTNLLTAVLATLMLLTTACGGKSNNASEIPADPVVEGISPVCHNCEGFVAGPEVFSGNLNGAAYSIQGLKVVADQNSIANITTANPRTTGTYQGMAIGGTFIANGTSSCIPNGTYQIQGFQVGVISPDLQTQSISPMWVALTGPTTFKAPMYIKIRDTNGDDVADVGTNVYLWFYCNGGWTSVGMSAQ